MAKCCICGKEVPVFGGKKVMIKGREYACFDCVKKAGHNPLTWTHNLSTTPEMLRVEINGNPVQTPSKRNEMKDTFDRKSSVAHARVSETFNPDRKFYKRFYVDTAHKKWQALGPVHDYADLVSYEYQEDGGTIISGGVGKAILGGALFGATGAVIGAATGKKKQSDYVNGMKIRLTVNDIEHPTEYVDMNPLRMRMKRSSGQYKKTFSEAQEILSCLQLIVRENQNNSGTADRLIEKKDSAEEILKYKKLLDLGAITQDEYEAKKKQLLGIV